MRNPGGWGFLTDTEGHVQEHETFTCMHCNRVTRIKPRQRPEDLGGMCKACMGLICPGCAGEMARGATCTPLVKQIEEGYEREMRRRQRYNEMFGSSG